MIVENVPGFEGSIAHARLRHALRGHRLTEVEWCPSQLGLPVQRRRFYLVASRHGAQPRLPEPMSVPLSRFLDETPPDATWLDVAFLDRFGSALHVVDADDDTATACCFTGAYGNSPVYAGSYLRQGARLRRFSVAEIARLHGFGDGFRLPVDDARAYKLLGNSLSVDVVRVLLGSVGVG